MSRNPIGQRALSLLLSLTLVLGIFGVDTVGAYAAQSSIPTVLYLDSGDILITDSGYSVGGGPIAAQDPSDSGYRITQNGNGTIQHTITVQGGTQDITVENININVSGTSNACAFSIAKGAAVNLTLEGQNMLKSGDYCAGLQVPGDASAPTDTTKNASLTVTDASTGSLNVTGGSCGAGIGGGRYGSGGSITINGGTVTANSGYNGAGIGGGYTNIGGSGGTITVTGGTVTATGNNGAGIGGGWAGGWDFSDCSVTISGGSVTATGGDNSAGIGSSGGRNCVGSGVTISGGSVTATGGNSAAGIGGGEGCMGDTVKISGTGTFVTAKGNGGKDIGSGNGNNSGGSLSVLDGATVTMQNSNPSLNTDASTDYKNCQIVIGGTETKYDKDGNVSSTQRVLYLDSGDIVITETGYSVNNGTEIPYVGGYWITQNGNGEVQHSITVHSGTQNITLCNVHARPNHNSAFEVESGLEADITLVGSNSLDTSGSSSHRAGLAVNAGNTVHISGSGSLTATGNVGSAGIGGDNCQSCGIVEISGGTVTANGENGSAGIGGGANGTGGNITISGGTVIANGNNCGAGIGGGVGGAGGTITVSGGSVTATGGDGSAGIGGGFKGAGGTITVSGGSVTATGGDNGAGIGGGYGGAGGTLTISGPYTDVTAKGQNGGRDIGSGNNNSNGGSLAVSGGAAVAMLNSDSSFNTNAVNPDTQSAPPKYRNCQIITGSTGKEYDGSGNVSSTRPVLYLDDGDIEITDTGATVGGSSVQRGPQNSGYLITQKNSGTIQHSIAVQSGTQNITLRDVHAKPAHAAAFEVGSPQAFAEADITLVGSNSLDTSGSSSNRAGLAVNAGNTVHISESGSLTATGNLGSAGIGGNYLNSCGTVEISGGTITANGADCSAGIGGGSGGAGGNITITGGTVNATGGNSGAGIGGGESGAGGTIKITGGTVIANGGRYAAGIGGGSCGSSGTVTISGLDTEVTAKGQNSGYDIGSGYGSTGGGTLTVGDSNTAEPLPNVELLSAGTNAANPDTSRPQFMNSVILGTGAKDASGKDISGCYDKNGKLRLNITMPTPSIVKVGESVTLCATIKRYYFNDTVTLPGAVQFTTGSGKMLGSSPVTNGMAQTNWTPTDGNEVWLTAVYIPAANDRYAQADSVTIGYTPGKITSVVSAKPTASQINYGSKLSMSTLTGGSMVDTNGAAVHGKFEWAVPDTVVTASGNYNVIFIPNDTTDYNQVGGIMVPVTVTAESPSAGSFSPTLPSSLTDAAVGVEADLSGATFPSYVSSISLSVTKPARDDRQTADFSTSLLAGPSTGVINIPELRNISLLDQNGSPVSFTGTVRVKIPLPAGVRGTPRVFRCEPDTKKFTDMNAVVENGYLVFSTDHFGDYAVAGVGNAIVLDTLNYQMPANGQYQIGLRLPGTKAASVKYYSTNDKVAAVIRLKNGNYQVIGKGTGTAYIMFDVYDNKNHLLTHASVRVDVKTGIRPRGDSTRQFGIF
ncbi:MAG TPA: hypothetical protein VHP31_11775 [Caproicibacter sp.]|nr:hypothetical protein [Caproicibacter sp.]